MAMTKAEKAEMEGLRRELRETRALRHTDPVPRDVPAPGSGAGFSALTRGWDYNDHAERVYKACSSSISHGQGWEKTSSQRPCDLYSSELLALRAMRHTMERKAAQKLARIDALIDEASTGSEVGK